MKDLIYKAYSLLTEKSVENGARVITGMATTPTPDRVSDIVVPEGVVFRTRDIKLHLYHDTRLPVGTVRFGKATKKGIPFEASIPEVEESGVVKSRVDEAWHSVKYNLLSAVSIGFKALEDGVELMQNGGLRFKSWEMIELSLTSVPANPEAVLNTLKDLSEGDVLPRHIVQQIKNQEALARHITLISAREGHLRNGAVNIRR